MGDLAEQSHGPRKIEHSDEYYVYTGNGQDLIDAVNRFNILDQYDGQYLLVRNLGVLGYR